MWRWDLSIRRCENPADPALSRRAGASVIGAGRRSVRSAAAGSNLRLHGESRMRSAAASRRSIRPTAIPAATKEIATGTSHHNNDLRETAARPRVSVNADTPSVKTHKGASRLTVAPAKAIASTRTIGPTKTNHHATVVRVVVLSAVGSGLPLAGPSEFASLEADPGTATSDPLPSGLAPIPALILVVEGAEPSGIVADIPPRC